MASQPLSPADEPADGEAMPDSELVSILDAHASQAIGFSAGGEDEITAEQELALNYYNRVMPDVPAMANCSSVVDGTVALVVDNALAAVLKPFVSSDETVRFAPRSEEDIEFAEQATEYVNYIFNSDNPGFLILHDWFKDGLLSKLGVVKVWWEENPTIANRQELQLEDEMQAAYARTQPGYLGEQDGIAVFGEEIDDGRVKVANIPPEEFRISKNARTIADAPYTAHVPTNIIRSDLIEMGFDPDIVDSLPAYADSENSTLKVARYEDQNYDSSSLATVQKAQDIIAIRDEYTRIDYDGDGIAEMRRIVRVGDVVLLNEEVDENPFAGVCPVPMPHKVYGIALADLAVQEQRISTVLWRQMLDNLYKSNNPRPIVGEGAEKSDGSTGETLGDSAPGAAVRLRDISQFRFDAVPYTAGHSMPMLEMVAARVEETTGVSRSGQGIDTNALKKTGQMTATEAASMEGGKNARTEMVARIFAETGVKRLFKLILGLVNKHQQQARIIRLRNKWVPMDPRGWPEMDVTISVGLGIGNKVEQVALSDSVLQTMAGLALTPYATLIDQTKVYNAVKRKFTAAGIKDTDEYLIEPQEGVQQPEKPDPELIKARMEAQQAREELEFEKIKGAAQLELEREKANAKLSIEQMKNEQKMALEAAKAQQQQQLADAKASFEAGLAERQFHFEQQLAVQQQQFNEEQARRDADRADKEIDTIPNKRPGGDLDK